MAAPLPSASWFFRILDLTLSPDQQRGEGHCSVKNAQCGESRR